MMYAPHYGARVEEQDASYARQRLDSDLDGIIKDATQAGALLMDCIQHAPSQIAAGACPKGVKEFLRQEKGAAARKVQEHIVRLKTALPAVEAELRRLDVNARRLQTDREALSAATLRTHYSEAFLDQKERHDSALLQRNRVKETITGLERALDLAQSDYGPQVAKLPREKPRRSMIEAEKKIGIWR